VIGIEIMEETEGEDNVRSNHPKDGTSRLGSVLRGNQPWVDFQKVSYI
jgi:hypothetical protein